MILLTLPTLLAAATLAGTPDWVTFVDANLTTGANDGSSWANAFRGPLGLRNALLAGRPGTSKVIWAAEGTYYPGPAGSPATTTFTLTAGVSIYGGFAGGETDYDQADPASHPTVLTGDLPGGPAGQPELEAIVTINNGDWDTSLHGVILDVCITGTPANTLPNPRRAVVINGGDPEVSGCVIRDGRAPKGGGVLLIDSDAGLYDTTISDCIAQLAGGGVYSDSTGDPRFIDCTFLNNGGGLGAGLYMGTYGNEPVGGVFAVLGDCAFIDCHSVFGAASGGGAYLRDALPEFSNCTFRHCTVGGGGGGIFSETSSLWLSSCRFIDCSAAGDGGGGLYAMEDPTDPPGSWWTADLENCLFTGNNGAVLANGTARVSLANCTITNGAKDPGQPLTFAAVLATGGSTIEVSNSIVWGNAPVSGAAYGGSVMSLGGSSIAVLRCDVEGWTGPTTGVTGVANFSANPQFIDRDGADDTLGTADDDLRLRMNSPCLDAGHAEYTNDNYWTDIDGDSRFYDMLSVADTGSGWATYLDVGCFERNGADCPTDLTGDGLTDAADLAFLLGEWGQQWNSTADLSDDGIVNASDLAILLGSFGSCL